MEAAPRARCLGHGSPPPAQYSPASFTRKAHFGENSGRAPRNLFGTITGLTGIVALFSRAQEIASFGETQDWGR